MAKIIEIRRTELDGDFRQKVKELLDSAEREIVVITGEFSAYGYLDLRWATERAIERGAKFRMYATSPTPQYANKILMLGGEVYRGKKRTKDHFLIVDGKSWVRSREHPSRAVGERWGEVHMNDRKGAKPLLREFNNLLKAAEKIEGIDHKVDPLTRAIENPRDWGIETDSRNFEKELFG